MRSEPARATGKGLEEDSDVVVALIRTAFIIAFYMMRYMGGGARIPLFMDATLWAAAVFNLALLALYLRKYSLHPQRPVGLVLDLLLVTAVYVTAYQSNWDLFNLYYLVLIPAAVWYRVPGSVIVAILAIGLAIVSHTYLLPLYALPAFQQSAKGPLLLLIGVIAGYLMRARDSEHLAIVAMRQEMRLARSLQSQLLPSGKPEVPGYELGVIFEPARQVGGDFYDLRLLSPDHLLIVLADMSGKSVYGLVHLSLVFSHLQSAANEGFGPAEMARMVNRGTYAALQPESYASLFVGVLRLSDGLLNFVNCGHVPPVRLRRLGQAAPDLLITGGTVIGAIREPMYEERSVVLNRGDMLLCYSDGISEARDKRRELFGEERVAQVARELMAEPAQQVADGLYLQVQKHAARPGQDDITVLVICRDDTTEQA